MNDKIGNGPAFFETWLANADEVEPSTSEYTADQRRAQIREQLDQH